VPDRGFELTFELELARPPSGNIDYRMIAAQGAP
jgi:hypothetical protein